MHIIRFKLFVLLACIVFVGSTAMAQTDTLLTVAINKYIIPIRISPTDTDYADLQALKPFIKDKQVFGLGEATHGTHEFFAFKHRMLQYLIKEFGVKTFVIEADFAGTQVMNDYVLYGKGSPQKAIESMGIGVWMVGEVVDMVNWLKLYNSTQSQQNKVQFWGCDMQWGSSAMRYLKQYLEPRGQFTQNMQDALTGIDKYLNSISKADIGKLKKAIKAIAAIPFENKDSAVVALNHHYLKELEQYVEFYDSRSAFFPAKSNDVRDKYMAENCLWIYNHTGKKKMMIWAHNGHINKSSGSDRYVRMGSHLSNYLKTDYYAMGFDFYSGKLRSYNAKEMKIYEAVLPEAIPGSTGYVFSKCLYPNFIFDLKSASVNPLINTFINSKILTAQYGAGALLPHYITYKHADTFDAIIFVKETTAAQNMK